MAEKDRMRKKELRVKLADEEWIGLKKRAEAAGLNLSEYARKALFDCMIIKYESFDISKLANELNHIGININQIAKHINERGGEYEKKDIEKLISEFQDMQTIVYDAVWGIESTGDN